MHRPVIVLDFGSQYTQLIVRRVREQRVYAELYPWDTPGEEILALDPYGFILSGGPESIYQPSAPQIPDYVLKSELPVLGICYGMQALTHSLGGHVNPAPQREYGLANLNINKRNPLLPTDTEAVWMSHGDRIDIPPQGFEVLASTANSPIAAMGDTARDYYGIQFHPEVKHTRRGADIIRNFVLDICKAVPDWTPESIIEESIARIREQVGEHSVMSAVSGGVDSSVATTLVLKAVGDQLKAVFVDNGLLRLDEPQQVVHTFKDNLGVQLFAVNAVEEFMDALEGVLEPEQKRKIIGERFIRIFEDQAQRLGKPEFLVQGTIYPDVVESSAPDRSQANRIKTHHNVGGLPEDMQFSLVEPLRYLFKDEVREVGEALGLPEEIVWRQPFPGPGLAVRCLGEVNLRRLDKLRQADAIFTRELKDADLLRWRESDDAPLGSSQAFAVLLPIQAVGVMGDQRTYEEVIALRAVTTDDFMTADWARLPHDLLARVANRIVNEVQGINRVVYDITTKPPATIEWE